jgi:hypothetical protein
MWGYSGLKNDDFKAQINISLHCENLLAYTHAHLVRVFRKDRTGRV